MEPQKSSASKASVKCFSVRTVNLVNHESSLNEGREELKDVKQLERDPFTLKGCICSSFIIQENGTRADTPGTTASNASARSVFSLVYFCLFQASPAK